MKTTSLLWMAGFGAVIFSCLFSGMESGLFALNRLRLRQMARRGDHRARALVKYLEAPENFLWTILLGNTFANFVFVSFTLIGLSRWEGLNEWAQLVVFLLVLFTFYVCCDLTPKILFRTYPTRLCLALSRPFGWAHATLSPCVRLLDQISSLLLKQGGAQGFTGRLFGNREELREVMQDSARTFTTETRAMINRLMDLQKLTVRQVMIPIERAVAVTDLTSWEDLLRLGRERGFTRYPVWQTTAVRRRIVGVVNLKETLYADEDPAGRRAGELLVAAQYLGEDLRLEDALRLMQRSGHRLAVVLGRDLREIGLLSLQDILDVIFGKVNL